MSQAFNSKIATEKIHKQEGKNRMILWCGIQGITVSSKGTKISKKTKRLSVADYHHQRVEERQRE